MKRNLSVITFLFALLFINAAVFGNSNNVYDADFLKSVEDLHAQVMELKNQYVSITSSLERIQLEIPRGLQNFSDLFYIEGQNLVVGPDGNIYYNDRDIRDYVSIMDIQSGNTGDTDVSDTNPTRSSYVTMEQFNQLADLVFTLSATCQTLSANLTSLQSTVSSISASQSSMQNSLQNLTTSYNQLNELCNNLTSAVKVNSDGSVVIAKSSPIIGKIEPRGNGSLYTLAQNWDRCCSKFRVSTNTFLESITLYCDDPNKIPASGNVYISTVVKDEFTENYSFQSWPCVNVNTSDFPRCVWTFTNNRKIQIFSDRDYLLCMSKSNGALYPYVTSSLRQGSFYKPFGATEELPPEPPPNSPDPELPRSSPSAQAWFDYLFYYYWEVSINPSLELWSILKFTDDESFTFSEGGLSVESGNITIAGSEVVTSSSLGDMFVSMLAEHPNALNSKINWSMFCRELQSNLITRSGGTIIGDLTVSKIRFESDTDWEIGTQNVCSDIVFLNPNSRIRSNAGSLKLSAIPNESISAESFLSFDSSGQAGIVTIPDGQTSIDVACDNLTPQAIIMLTPRQPLSNVWWSVQNNQSATNFTVKITRELQEPISFNYVIIRK